MTCDEVWEARYHARVVETYNRLLNMRKINHKGNLRDLVLKTCKGKVVLDVGGAEHRFSATENKERFMHGRICGVAKECIGIDIVVDAVKKLNNAGYKFVCCDATSNKYLGKKFDVVNMGDVIEHVDNPVALICFAKRHLKKGGVALVATPNPFVLSALELLLLRGTFVANLEHTSWITPSMALEIGRRAKLKLNCYYVSEPATVWKKLLLGWVPIEFKSGSFLYVYKN